VFTRASFILASKKRKSPSVKSCYRKISVSLKEMGNGSE